MEQPAATKRRPGRPPKHGEPKRAFFQTRIRETLKQRLEASAAEQGRSLSEEIELRLEGSYNTIESRFGGAAGLRLAIFLWGTFDYAAGQQAALNGHPEWEAGEYLPDEACFEAGVIGLIESLRAQHPQLVGRALGRSEARHVGRELTKQLDEQARAAAENNKSAA